MDTVALDSRLSKPATAFLSQHRKLLINGKWVGAASGKTFSVYNPATGTVLAQVAEADKEDVDRAVAAARKAFDDGPWRRMTGSQRARLLWKLADLVERRLDAFAEIESIDNGKPMAVARVADVPLTVDMFRYMGGWATKMTGSTIPWSVPNEFLSYTLREPVGVVGQIIPWNFPLLMAAWKLGPALAAGCTVVLKVAEQTPLSALLLGECIQEAGFPEGVVNILAGYGETAGAALAAHDDVDKVAFTGSTEVGKLIVKAAAGNLKKVSLELGGKSPSIIFGDADVEAAIPGAASAIFFNHGQCCCAGSRLYAHKKVFDQVLEGVAAEAKKIKVGPGLDPSTGMGPLVSEEQYARVTGYIESGLKEGAKAVTGGMPKGRNGGYFVEPTVLTNTKPTMKVVREEIFGPVVCAEAFDDADLEKVARQANNTVYGLAASVWTKDISKAHKLAAMIRSGTVWINCHNVFDASLPFGGFKQSGWGREMGGEVLNNYLETKAVTAKL
ncbi:MAG: aldehyde dehydrogenase family protein [Alphaproteobacteria bacterium]|nr:aldehyde dehydrogenase family protein [Alphaproteobacteria bacterium]